MKILHNAHIYTQDPRQPSASAIVIADGKILAVGGEELLHQHPQAELQDMAGCTILPGLTDAHIHLQLYVLNDQKIDCEVPSKDEILKRVAERVKKTHIEEWILGHGWNQNLWGGEWPSAADLDAVAPLNPVYLTAKSLHAAWCNSSALRRAKIKKRSRNPREGIIQRDRRGQPTGILLEKATNLVENAIPKPHPENLAGLFEQAIPRLWRMGLTGIHNFDREASFRALQILNARGGLRLRVLQAIPREDIEVTARLGLRTGMGDDMLRIGPVKLFSDGALGPHTGAMFEPYVDEPENRGILLMDADDVFEYGREAARAGLSLAVHAIGDRANHEVLDGFARLRDDVVKHKLPALRHRIEHVQVLHEEDAGRLAQLGIVASMQPIHALSDMEMADKAWGGRSALAYAWQTQVRNGARLAFGSDAPVDSPNPFWGLHAALTRRRVTGFPGPDGWYPEQRLPLREALEAYTLGPAYAAGMEDRLGRLAAGYLADLIVLDVDPFACDPSVLREIQPRATMVGGDWVWQA
ncbi:MAG: amidohydrolase family protein [Chloroflexota bacterium]